MASSSIHLAAHRESAAGIFGSLSIVLFVLIHDHYQGFPWVGGATQRPPSGLEKPDGMAWYVFNVFIKKWFLPFFSLPSFTLLTGGTNLILARSRLVLDSEPKSGFHCSKSGFHFSFCVAVTTFQTLADKISHSGCKFLIWRHIPPCP